jgi:hypothetical protein
MKREYLGWVVASVVVIVVAASGAAAPDGQIGRFQIFTGTVAVLGETGQAGPSPGVFLLDTASGKTWNLLVQLNHDDLPPMSWTPIAGPR